MKNKGFTLIELSIVLVILGLLVGGIVGGKALIHQAELQSVIREVNGIKTAINAFTGQYDSLPGDFAHASDYWGVFDWGQLNVGALNGNEDNILGDEEGASAYRHMSLADIIPGTYYGWAHIGNGDGYYMPSSPTPDEGAINVPGSKLPGGAYVLFNNAWGLNGPATRENFIIFANFAIEHVTGTGILIAKDAKNIDQKLDDGLAGTGKVRAKDNADHSADCSGGYFDFAEDTTYRLANTTDKCILYFYIQ